MIILLSTIIGFIIGLIYIMARRKLTVRALLTAAASGIFFAWLEKKLKEINRQQRRRY